MWANYGYILYNCCKILLIKKILASSDVFASFVIAQASALLDKNNKFVDELVPVRFKNEFELFLEKIIAE